MSAFPPTPEQQAIIKAAVDQTNNLAVIARAGAAKTSTLVLIAEALPTVKILCLAFNKKIATEMTERLPPNCTASTLHSLGYAAWRKFVPGRPRVNDRKCYFLLREEIDRLDDEDKKFAYDEMSEILDIVRTAKGSGYLPNSYKGHWKSHFFDEEFEAALPKEHDPLIISLAQSVLISSFKAALAGEVDFDDMIYCPALCSATWPSFPLVLVDEAQDLSPLNQYIIKKLTRRSRLIAVGDPCQAIYGFRGADSASISNLVKTFDMEKLYLTISFRCGKEITKNVHWRAPDMKSPTWAEDGEVLRPLSWSPLSIPDDSAVICRNNAPLFSMALLLIEHGKTPEILGNDISARIKKILKKLGKPSSGREIGLTALEDWKQAELRKARKGAGKAVHDLAACISIILKRTETIGDAAAYLDHLLSRKGRITLCTGHKSKGLEFDEVFFLEPKLINKEYEQDLNLQYVIETRAKKKLTYIEFALLEGASAPEEAIV